ncbi:MAG: fibrobacter succinogenes major paralogous domain-containing protein [Bacteroidota bacterium]
MPAPKNLTLIILLALAFSCKKKPRPLYVTTLGVAEIEDITALSGGLITGEGVTAKGVCWGTEPSPELSTGITNEGVGSDSYQSRLTGLSPLKTYYVWAYAANESGVTYADPVKFTSAALVTGSVFDIDNNNYPTVRIGSKQWMQKNLQVTRYRNGDPIALLPSDNSWTQTQSGAYCVQPNLVISYYGGLYNWFAVNDARNIAPVGWHVATQADWDDLLNTLGGTGAAAPKMRIVTPQYWPTTSSNTNESGFTALPAGYRVNGSFSSGGTATSFWTNTSAPSSLSWAYTMNGTSLNSGSYSRSDGRSVRCVKD